MKTITIIIPSYNEEKNIRPFYDETTPYLNHPEFVYEILYVNDGSKDDTLGEIKKLAKEDRRVKYLSFSRNFGKEAAMHAGLEASQHKDCVVIIDCDLQQPPHQIPKMIEHYLEGYKIVYTKGATRKGEPKMRTFFANLYYRIYNKYTDTPLDNGAKDYQLLDKDVVKAFLSLGDKYRFVKGIFSWVGYKRKCLEYDFIPRRYGKSTWSFKTLFRYGFNGMNQFSQIMMILPLLSFLTGILLLGVAIALYALSVFTLGEFLLSLQGSVVLLVLTGLFYGLYYLTYGLRKQVLNRPIYLVEEASDIDE